VFFEHPILYFLIDFNCCSVYVLRDTELKRKEKKKEKKKKKKKERKLHEKLNAYINELHTESRRNILYDK
jgi:hypothetical protein